jgi:hypothetical protein
MTAICLKSKKQYRPLPEIPLAYGPFFERGPLFDMYSTTEYSRPPSGFLKGQVNERAHRPGTSLIIS